MANFWENDPIVEDGPKPKPWERYAQRKPRWGTPETLVKPRFKGTLVKEGGNGAENLDWSDVPGEAVKNLLPSAGQLLKDTVAPFLDLPGTAKNIGALIGGVAAKAGIGSMDESAADAVGQMFLDRYGSFDALKLTIATDPAGFLSDVSAALTAGAMLGAKAPGMAGKIASVAGKTADLIDPLSLTARAGAGALKAAGNVAATGLGVSTGVGGDTTRAMATAGREGNTIARDMMRGADETRVLDMADDAMSAIQKDRSDAYLADIASTKASGAQVDFAPVVQKFSDLKDVYSYQGKVTNKEAARTARVARKQFEDFYTSGSAYHTPEAADALRQSLNELRGTTEPGSKARLVVDGVLHTLKAEIEKVSPGYAKALDNYAESSRQISELRRTLSLGPGATRDTTLRKLQSTTRNNANTNYGQRVRLLDQLAAKQPALPGALAGLAMSSLEPRSLARIGSPLSYGLGGAMAGGLPGALLSAGVGMAASSPRISGELAYGVGRAARAADLLSPAQRRLMRQMLFQSGRANRAVEERRGPWNRYRTK